MVVWQVDPSGEYTVRSGYRLLQGNRDLNENTVECYNLFYKKLWKLKLPKKTSGGICDLPKSVRGVANLEHGFRDRHFVAVVWDLLNIKWNGEEGRKNFQDWLFGLFYNSSEYTCRQIACTIWILWPERNKWVHDRVFASSLHIVSMISSYVAKLNEIVKKLPVVKVCLERWRPPYETFVKIDFGAAFHVLSSNSCSGIIIREGRSKTIAEKVTVNGNIVSVFAAEALACLQALSLGVDLGFQRVVVEGDSLSVIKKANSSGVDRSAIGAYIQDIRIVRRRFKKCEIVYAPERRIDRLIS
ncbi:hypothetical protein Gogos_012770 [Gossypium gossypioides]|uniref:RNase H type-1 domain-containing protein n=1 Tax=Gossypium gossypioides TaxID=34282 RepID=A0A7J9BTV0_GOSGO|nr:hypothetical protein [Gossypium gossypioides]